MSNNDNIARQGVYNCGVIFEKLGFIFREQPICDYGIDALIETKDENYPLGKLIAVQIKSGNSYFNELKEGNVVFHGDIKHYDYWLNYSLPVIIVLYSPIDNKFIWEVINEKTVQLCKNGWKINIPYNQTLESSSKQLRDLANKQSDFERRLCSLVFAKELMLEIIKYEEIILEIEEWVNKSSGRGKLTFKVQENIEEKILYETEIFGIGLNKYEQVIQELLPWASIKIDENFYEENIEEDYYSYKNNDIIPNIYPCMNIAGEVDFYRLKLTLNNIGTSFIELNHFLETGI